MASRSPLQEVIERAIAVKARIVSQDFREGSVRAYLNYGHTVGHAVEVAGGISHGAAVAVGMVAAGHVGERTVGFERRIEQEQLRRIEEQRRKREEQRRMALEAALAVAEILAYVYRLKRA